MKKTKQKPIATAISKTHLIFNRKSADAYRKLQLAIIKKNQDCINKHFKVLYEMARELQDNSDNGRQVTGISTPFGMWVFQPHPKNQDFVFSYSGPRWKKNKK